MEACGTVDVRMYANFGDNATSRDPLAPMLASFVIDPLIVTRYWALYEHVVNDFDRVSVWMADERRDPVRLFDRLKIAASAPIDDFEIEFNSSQDRIANYQETQIIDLKNVVMLKDVTEADMPPLLVKPTAWAT